MEPLETKKAMTPLYLIGYRCTGKSTTGQLLATLMGFAFLDTDRVIEERFKTTIEEMIHQKGWDYFRKNEKQVLLDTGHLSNTIVATGGGIVLDSENRKFIQTHGICAWLYADGETIVKRLLADENNPESRPRFSQDSLTLETQKTLALRTPLYRELSQIKIDTSCHSPKEAASIIKRRISHVR
jgi:shikimate kinase